MLSRYIIIIIYVLLFVVYFVFVFYSIGQRLQSNFPRMPLQQQQQQQQLRPFATAPYGGKLYL